MTYTKLTSCLGLAALLAGCGTPFEPKPMITEIKAEQAITSTASLSHTLVLDRKTGFVTCAMPPPDAAFAQQEEGDVSISLISLGGNKDAGGEQESSSEDELAGRTPAVLITRELFFRLCEFSRNYQLNKAEAMKLYRETLTAVKGGWDKEAGQTTVKIGDAVTTIINNAEGGKLPTISSKIEALSGTTNAKSGSASSSSTSTSSSSSTTNPFGSSTTNPFGN